MKKLFIISNESIYKNENNEYFCDNLDIKSTPEGLGSSFEINEGQIFGMLGPNGVGKSTIFNLITGLINPDNGKIYFLGEGALWLMEKN